MSDTPTPEREAAPVDLTPIAGLRLDPARADALLARIEAAAVPGLERRAALAAPARRPVPPGRELERVLARFSWAAFAAAAAAVLLVVQTSGNSEITSTATLSSVATAVTETDSTTQWIAEQSVPTDADLVYAYGLENGP